METETEVSIRQALIQVLGGLDATLIPPGERDRIVEQLKALYIDAPNAGVHASASWTLRKWGEQLPDLPIGQPMRSEEQKARVAKLEKELEDIRQKLANAEKELPQRQAAWEQQFCDQPFQLPTSLSEGLIAHYPFDETEGDIANNAVANRPNGVYTGSG